MLRLTVPLLLIALASGLSNCLSKKEEIDNIVDIPEVQAIDTSFANVYQLLDGIWEGEFIIYEDQSPAAKAEIDLENISAKNLNRSSLKEVNRIQVRQEYSSETPYFQKVKIIDTYPDTDKQEISTGVNKVQNGQMWCVVRKPSETVIHRGSLDGANTIIWQRDESNPQRIEYFRETVATDTYEIVGWGYYEGDNPTLSPRLWFYAAYQKQ